MKKYNYQVVRDRMFMLAPSYWSTRQFTGKHTGSVYGHRFSVAWQVYYPDGRMRGLYPADEIAAIGRDLGQKMHDDGRFFERVIGRVRLQEEKLKSLYARADRLDAANSPDSELNAWAIRIMEHTHGYEGSNMCGWWLAAENLGKILRDRLKVPEEEFDLLSQPSAKTAAIENDRELIRAAVSIQATKVEPGGLAKELSKKFGHLPHGFDGPEYWDQNHYIKLLEELAAKPAQENLAMFDAIEKNDEENRLRREALFAKHMIGKKDRERFSRLNSLVALADERKTFTFKLYFHYNKIMSELGKRYDIPYKHIKYLFTEELTMLAGDPRKRRLAQAAAESRINGVFVVQFQAGRHRILDRNEAEEVIKAAEQNAGGALKGKIASQGPRKVYEGRVKVLRSASEGDKVYEGDILVAAMTTPDYIVAMKKAAGFITDEGGLTCHAAIIAREMGKPCIIATGNATGQLKDGDRVRMNMETGEIEKIQ